MARLLPPAGMSVSPPESLPADQEGVLRYIGGFPRLPESPAQASAPDKVRGIPREQSCLPALKEVPACPPGAPQSTPHRARYTTALAILLLGPTLQGGNNLALSVVQQGRNSSTHQVLRENIMKGSPELQLQPQGKQGRCLRAPDTKSTALHKPVYTRWGQ
ncbi:hypothetical protein NDU88_001175 [Pleurodeles waltl]|uniref:Uncharacterized protein n=1 Tax=Pleurodeles waltl TaxID=8319 RepID=A0AAV7Q903_PLEWA|nr:hypothetical protein NDU88_001175 [Pleurodeles waltl]